MKYALLNCFLIGNTSIYKCILLLFEISMYINTSFCHRIGFVKYVVVGIFTQYYPLRNEFCSAFPLRWNIFITIATFITHFTTFSYSKFLLAAAYKRYFSQFNMLIIEYYGNSVGRFFFFIYGWMVWIYCSKGIGKELILKTSRIYSYGMGFLYIVCWNVDFLQGACF